MRGGRLTEGLVFGESPRWHAGELWISDIHAHRVVAVNAAGEPRVVCELDDRPGGLGFLPTGTPLVVSMLDRQLLRIEAGKARLQEDLTGLPGDFLLDMVVDGLGRAYIGVRNDPDSGAGLDDTEAVDAILVVEPSGGARVAAEEVVSPNGLGVTPDGGTLIVAETRAARLVAYRIEASGSLGQRRIWAELPGTHPDGICLDSEGGVWCGSPTTREFLRVTAGGNVTHRVPLGEHWGVACVLGGLDRKTLYGVVTDTTLDNLTRLGRDRQLDRESRSKSWVETMSAPAPGAGWP
jgi:sugar lactone lactonase YvrE